MKIIKLIALLSLLALPAAAQITPTNPPANVSLAWDASPDPSVGSYRLYWGAAPRFYTNAVTITGTTATIGPLVRGVRYYFAATCVSTNGLESDFSNEVTYQPPLPPQPPVLRLSISGGKLLIGIGEPAATYAVQRTTNFVTWDTIGSVEADAGGGLEYCDTNAPAALAYYRLEQI